MIHVDFPFCIDGRGRTALAGEDAHLRNLIEQVLFTTPGERVNRPTFGSGLLQLVFAPNSDVLAGVVETTVRAALQQHLADLVEVQAVSVASEDGRLDVTVQYVVRRTQNVAVAQFSRRVG
jgi:phage baseplate assembly protein W